MKFKKPIAILFVVIILVNCACVKNDVIPTPTTPVSSLAENLASPDIYGTVTEVFVRDGRINAIHVDGTDEVETEYDKATVRLTEATQVFEQSGESYRIVSSEQLTVGVKVKALFTGLVLERYPVSAEASEILITH